MTTHCRSLLGKPSECWAEGSAMFTMVESRITISWAMATMNRISQRWSFAGGDWSSAGDAVMGTHFLRVRIAGDELGHRVV